MAKARLLITRFAPHALRLSNLLNAQGTAAFAQPLLEVKQTAEFDDIRMLLTGSYDYIIAVSSNAVDYTKWALADNPWPAASYLAVGKGTQAVLRSATGKSVSVPDKRYDSEGLLALPCLSNIQGKRILILRGLGGRELLSETLTARGAVVEYYQPYQRVAIELNGSLLTEKWRRLNINGVIISSVELLERLLVVVPESEHKWLKNQTIYAPSKRITVHAVSLGWSSAEVLPGMADQQIVDYFK
ncbi:uroporphyrinogen-III synthase [Psychromonas ossibalaenae]|uniref:uroporphyrinogen-III synthase n=1 Tax=Psychromonas ossibalaenae TaxID=444922 RepID=UPI00035FD78C|nr:uroporphyrinogen-III synthase [Psychromonas ossibalaenae]